MVGNEFVITPGGFVKLWKNDVLSNDGTIGIG